MTVKFTAKAYYIFMFLLPFVFYPGVLDTALLPRQIYLSVFTVLLAIVLWKTVRSDKSLLKIDVASFAFATFVLVAASISLTSASVISEALYSMSKLWVAASFLVATTLLLKSRVIAIKDIIGAAVIFGCVSVAIALYDINAKNDSGTYLTVAVYKISGSFGNKNLLASILVLCLPFLAIGLRGKKLLKSASSIALFFALFVLLVVRTRIALVATIIFFGIITFFYARERFGRKVWAVMIVLVSLGAIVLTEMKFSGLFGTPQSPGDFARQYAKQLLATETFKERLLFWENSWQMFLEHPFGVGLGNWQIYFPKYGLEKFDTFEMVNGLYTLQRPHNDFLWILCEAGIVGLLLFLSVLAILIYRSFRQIKTASDGFEKWISICSLAGIIAFLPIAFFDFPMERIEHLVMLMLLFAMIIHRGSTIPAKNFQIVVSKSAVLTFVVGGICLSLLVSVSRFSSEKNVFRMVEARKQGYHQQAFTFAKNAESAFYEIDTKTIPLQWYQGVAKFSAKQFAESEACFEKAYELTPYGIHVLNNLASNYEVNGKRQDAIEFYQKALQISPMFEEARLNLAAVYFNNREFGKAFQTIDRCAADTRDAKYKIFLPPILKAEAQRIVNSAKFPASPEKKDAMLNLQDYLQIYYESKKNNTTFESQIIKHLNKNL